MGEAPKGYNGRNGGMHGSPAALNGAGSSDAAPDEAAS
jgi:hypothetical protein